MACAASFWLQSAGAFWKKGGPKTAFLVIGGAIALSWILSTIFFYVPDDAWIEAAKKENGAGNTPKEQKQYTSWEMVRTKRFYFLLATMLFGLISYFMISPVSQTYQIDMGIPASVAVSAVMLGSIVNAGTRLVLPTLADKIGRIGCIQGVILISIGAMAALSFGSSYVVTAAIVVMYGCYGGIMGSFPSFTSSIFGMKYSGENYGYVMFAIVIATFGAPAITSLVKGKGFAMQNVFLIGMCCAIVAFIFLKMLKRELSD